MTIESLIKTYETALNTNDIDAILGLYGTEPVFMPQHAPALVGRDAVRAGYKQVFETIKLNIRFEIHELQEAGDWAWARTSSAGRTRILAANIELQEGNNEMFIFRKEAASGRFTVICSPPTSRVPEDQQPSAWGRINNCSCCIAGPMASSASLGVVSRP